MAATAAAELLRADPTFAGLPSQETRASRVLANTQDAISRLGASLADAGTTTDATAADPAEADRFVGTAEDLYGAAFDLFGQAAYQRAMLTAHAARAMVLAGGTLGLASPGNGTPRVRAGSFRDHREGHSGQAGHRCADHVPGDSLTHFATDHHLVAGHRGLDHVPGDDDSLDGMGDASDDDATPVTVPDPTFD